MGFDSYVPKPFKYNEILEVLETNLDIEFNYKSPKVKKTTQKALDELDWASIKISPEIKTEIMNAANSYSVTGLENALERLGSMGAEEYFEKVSKKL